MLDLRLWGHLISRSTLTTTTCSRQRTWSPKSKEVVPNSEVTGQATSCLKKRGSLIQERYSKVINFSNCRDKVEITDSRRMEWVVAALRPISQRNSYPIVNQRATSIWKVMHTESDSVEEQFNRRWSPLAVRILSASHHRKHNYWITFWIRPRAWLILETRASWTWARREGPWSKARRAVRIPISRYRSSGRRVARWCRMMDRASSRAILIVLARTRSALDSDELILRSYLIRKSEMQCPIIFEKSLNVFLFTK